jgi:hypothetical protein
MNPRLAFLSEWDEAAVGLGSFVERRPAKFVGR